MYLDGWGELSSSTWLESCWWKTSLITGRNPSKSIPRRAKMKPREKRCCDVKDGSPPGSNVFSLMTVILLTITIYVQPGSWQLSDIPSYYSLGLCLVFKVTCLKYIASTLKCYGKIHVAGIYWVASIIMSYWATQMKFVKRKLSHCFILIQLKCT